MREIEIELNLNGMALIARFDTATQARRVLIAAGFKNAYIDLTIHN